jgi:hypothetical protein
MHKSEVEQTLTMYQPQPIYAIVITFVIAQITMFADIVRNFYVRTACETYTNSVHQRQEPDCFVHHYDGMLSPSFS